MPASPDPPATRLTVISALDFERASLESVLDTSDPGSVGVAGRISLVQSGVGGDRASAAARTALQGGADALMSWGVAGGLQRTLVPGDVVLPAAVRAADGRRIVTEPAWRERLAHLLQREFAVHQGDLLSVDQILATPQAKAHAAMDSGAIAVDMESAAIGEVAAAAGRPFIVLRVIIDGATDTLADVEGLMDQAGNRDAAAVLRSACNPAQWSRLWILSRRFRRARAALARCASVVAGDGLHYSGLA